MRDQQTLELEITPQMTTALVEALRCADPGAFIGDAEWNGRLTIDGRFDLPILLRELFRRIACSHTPECRCPACQSVAESMRASGLDPTPEPVERL